MYIMCHGSVAITKRLTLELGDEAPREKTMIRFRAEEGVILGEMALIESDVRSATVTAITPCLMLELTKEKFFLLLEQHPEIGVKILFRLARYLSQRLRKVSNELVKVTTALAIALES
jgi:CRP-like cAMP-binding protein